jgi:hypothetical protein
VQRGAILSARATQRLPDTLRYLTSRVRLLYEAGQSLAQKPLHSFRCIEAAGEKHRSIWADALYFAQGLLAAHDGHGQVQDDEIDLVALTLEDVDCLGAVRRRDGRIALPFNDGLEKVSDGGLVIDDQYPAGALRFHRLLD